MAALLLQLIGRRQPQLFASAETVQHVIFSLLKWIVARNFEPPTRMLLDSTQRQALAATYQQLRSQFPDAVAVR